MEKTSQELLQLEHRDPSSSFKETVLLVCGKKTKESAKERSNSEGQPFTALSLPKSQVLGKVKDFLGVISEANKSLQLNAKDLMLGVADLHTPEAVEAAEAVVAGNQPVVDLHIHNSSSESESSSDDSDNEDESIDDENGKASTGHSELQVDGSSKQQFKSCTKRKRPKIVELP